MWLQGHKAYMVPGDVFDVILKTKNQLYKIQVKSSSFSMYTHKALTFSLNRGCKAKKLYQIGEIDGYAFIDLVYKKVCYMSIYELNNKWKVTIQRKRFKDLTLDRLINERKKG